MRLSSYAADGGWRAGLAVDSTVVDAHAAARVAGLASEGDDGRWTSTRRLLHEAPATLRELDAAAHRCAEQGDGLPMEKVEIGPPVHDPQKILCLGFNYRAHAEEFDTEVPAVPTLFAKFAGSLLAAGGTILIPAVTRAVDFEGELAVVIGRRCKDVSSDDALGYVAGCMAFNDITARDLQWETSQWTAGKAIDTFAPCGPALVSLDEVGDVSSLSLRTRVNGVLMQEGYTSDMIFAIPETIAFVSQLMTLVPGDIIATGTPAGVGFRRDPPVYLAPGDTVEVEIDRIGSLRNEVASAPKRAVSGRSPRAQADPV